MSLSLVGLLNAVTPKSPRSRRIVSAAPFGNRARLKLDMYAPSFGGGPWPMVVFFYGGAWNEGDRRDYAFIGRWLAAQGYVVAVPDYGIIPEVEYPTFLEDCAAAVRWTMANAKGHGGDAARLGVMGHSAGAYNAVMMALEPGYGVARDIRAVVGLSGPYDFYPFDVPISIRTFREATDPLSTQPVNLVTPEAPPMLLASGDDDTVVGPHNTAGLASALRRHAVAVEELHYPGFRHPATLLELGTPLGRRSSLAGHVLAFLDRSLGAGAASPSRYDRVSDGG
ncbi:alpha/beta hydrolase [Devosia sp.]|uniref:alpha/beta hydrolase n=1 Tax=Devosia sp. TaxID=1871048 RepID=UPI001AD21A3B|nr:alpha/beta hydrolase [Devosia sp.]MBN9311289.1 alpha/beta hydrolase [Devosia sp.]